uniref:Uncharacterized protein n=1 Tax=Anopheles atroparvus TaxID=41427 RepID=A0A182JJR0_ANOAO
MFDALRRGVTYRARWAKPPLLLLLLLLLLVMIFLRIISVTIGPGSHRFRRNPPFSLARSRMGCRESKACEVPLANRNWKMINGESIEMELIYALLHWVLLRKHPTGSISGDRRGEQGHHRLLLIG